MTDDHQRSDAPSNIPVPDPSFLTTQQLYKEIDHLRALIYARLSNMDARSNELATAQALAVKDALAASDKATTALESSLNRRMEAADALTLSRLDGIAKEFVTHRTLLDSQVATTKAALDAANQAATKTEVYAEKRFEQLNVAIATVLEQLKLTVTRVEFETLRATTSEKIDDLKSQALRGAGKDEGSQVDAKLAALATQMESHTAAIVAGSGRSAGLNAGWAYLVGAVVLVGSVVAIVVALSGR